MEVGEVFRKCVRLGIEEARLTPGDELWESM